MIEDLQCSNAKQIFEISNIVYHYTNETTVNYYVKNETIIPGTRKFAGRLLIIICIIGTIGNLLNIASILYAKIKKLHGFDDNFNRIIIFILSLSVIEFFLLSFGMLSNALGLLIPDWHMNSDLCYMYPLVWRNPYIMESVSIAIISIGRCVDIVRPKIWRKYTSSSWFVSILLASPWLVWGISVIPVLTSLEIGIGWNCSVGYCTQILKCPLTNCPDKTPGWNFIVWYSFSVTVISIVTTIICYALIYLKCCHSTKNLLDLGNASNLALKQREERLTRTILVLLLSHCICNVPTLLTDTIIYSSFGSLMSWNIVIKCIFSIFYILFNFQFVINVFIYAGCNTDFQLAYRDFLKFMTCQQSKLLSKLKQNLI